MHSLIKMVSCIWLINFFTITASARKSSMWSPIPPGAILMVPKQCKSYPACWTFSFWLQDEQHFMINRLSISLNQSEFVGFLWELVYWIDVPIIRLALEWQYNSYHEAIAKHQLLLTGVLLNQVKSSCPKKNLTVLIILLILVRIKII